MRLRTLLICAAMLAGLAACDSDSDDRAAPTPSPAVSVNRPALPDGWRWESYRDIAVGVPGDWGNGGYGRWSAWCADGVGQEPAVGRPGMVFAILCWDPKKGGVNPGSLVANTGNFVAFAGGEDLNLPEEGDRQIVRIGTGGVIIQAPADLRARIAATVHVLESTDLNNCPLIHPISADASYRPTPLDAKSVTGTESLSVCKYSLRDAGRPASGPGLISSLQVDGDAAGRAVAAILAAPGGGGPNRTDPRKCRLDYGYGDEAYVVRIQRADREPAEIVVHYAGCTHNGFDDGRTVRTLTAEGLAALVAGPNQPNSFIGDRGMPGLMARARELAATLARNPGSSGLPYILRTHCGIWSATVAGVLWIAEPPLHDDSDNPPPGWENPDAPGMFVQLSETSAEFTADNGLKAQFKRAPTSAKDPYPQECN